MQQSQNQTQKQHRQQRQPRRLTAASFKRMGLS
jgi:hypothetical protein